MAQTQEGKKTFYIVLIVILILLNGFFAYKHWDTKKALEVKTQEKDAVDSLLSIANDSLTANKERIASLSGDNTQQKALLEETQRKLEAAISDFEKMKKEGNYSRQQLNEARNRVKVLQDENKRMLVQMDSLSTVLQFVTKERDSLNTGLQSQQAQNKQLLSEKEIFERKAKLGSLLKPENVTFEGIFMKSNDNPKPTTKAKKTTALRIKFNVPENKVADPGTKTYLIRILNPQGATISVESAGSGSFTTENGEPMQYTMAKEFAYGNQTLDGQFVDWTQPQAFGTGKYTAIFYQDGYELATYETTLK